MENYGGEEGMKVVDLEERKERKEMAAWGLFGRGKEIAAKMNPKLLHADIRAMRRRKERPQIIYL